MHAVAQRGAPGPWVDGLVGRKCRRRAEHPARSERGHTITRARATSGRLRVTSLPACPAEALHLRFAREDPTAVQAEELPDALGPPIAQGGRRRALEVHHLSMIRNAVGAQYRVGAEWARWTHRRHGVSLSRGHGARWYRPREAAAARDRIPTQSPVLEHFGRRPSVASFALRPACACASRKASRSRPAASFP